MSIKYNAYSLKMTSRYTLYRSARAGDLDGCRGFIKRGVDVNERDFDDNDTPLHYAVRHYHNVCVQFLLDSGADPCIKNKFDGYNPLQYAVRYYNITALRLLLERHPNCLNCQDKWARTLLHQAIYGDISYLKLLLEYGVDPCIRNKQSKLPEELVTNQNKIVLIQSYKFSFTKPALELDDY